MPIRVRTTKLVNGKKVRVWREASDDSREAAEIAIWGSEEARLKGLRRIAKALSKSRGRRLKAAELSRITGMPAEYFAEVSKPPEPE